MTRKKLERYGVTLNNSITYDEVEGVNQFPDGTHAFFCTNWADLAVKKFGGQRAGFMHEDNPTATVAEDSDGHDFALIGDYLVDYWIKFFEGTSEQCVFDLTDPTDKVKVDALYGDRAKWELYEYETATK